MIQYSKKLSYVKEMLDGRSKIFSNDILKECKKFFNKTFQAKCFIILSIKDNNFDFFIANFTSQHGSLFICQPSSIRDRWGEVGRWVGKKILEEPLGFNPNVLRIRKSIFMWISNLVNVISLNVRGDRRVKKSRIFITIP